MFPGAATIIGLLGQGASAVMSILNNRRMQQEADREAAREQAFYDAKANENPLSRSENQHILGQYDRQAQQQVETARNIAAIKGSTPEFSAAVQKGVAEGRANLMGQMAAGASARKDRFDTMGEMARHRKAQEDMQRRLDRNNTYAALAGNAASAVGAIMDGYSAPKAEAPAASNAQKLATGGAQIKTQGTDVGNLHVSQDGKVKNNLDWRNKATIETPKLPQNPYGTGAVGYIPNADGTFTKDGMKYMQNPDGSYRLIF